MTWSRSGGPVAESLPRITAIWLFRHADSRQDCIVPEDSPLGEEWKRRYEQSLCDENARNEASDDSEAGREFLFLWLVLAVPIAALAAIVGHDRSILNRTGSALGICLITYILTARLVHDD
jgi:hypothetical protein